MTRSAASPLVPRPHKDRPVRNVAATDVRVSKRRRIDPATDDRYNRQQPVFPAPRFPGGVKVAPSALLLTSLVASSLLLIVQTPALNSQPQLVTGAINHPALIPALALATVGGWSFIALWALIVSP